MGALDGAGSFVSAGSGLAVAVEEGSDVGATVGIVVGVFLGAGVDGITGVIISVSKGITSSCPLPDIPKQNNPRRIDSTMTAIFPSNVASPSHLGAFLALEQVVHAIRPFVTFI